MTAENLAGSLPYPERFHLAAKYYQSLPDKDRQAFSQDAQLLLYALQQQIVVGPCKQAKPWGWNVVESAKWQSWKQLGNMNAMEAMRLFVRLLEEEQKDWCTRATEAATATPGTEAVTVAPVPDRVEGVWSPMDIEGIKRPAPRYEQGAAVLGDRLYVVGGNYAGRYLSDVWSISIHGGSWTLHALASTGTDETAAAAPTLTPCAGHTLTAWGDKLYIVGGHSKGAAGIVAPVHLHVLDPASLTLSSPETTGPRPTARGSHSATLLGGKLYIFGGEDSSRRPLSDLVVLDMSTLEWSLPAVTGKVPVPRAAHTAVGFLDRYLVVFGGGSVATCLSDVHILDTTTLEWSQPAVEGPQVSGRAGHAAALAGSTLYVLGGGNNVKGCTDMLALELSAVPEGRVTWRALTSIPTRHPLSSEGISLLPLPDCKSLLAFGGYNGKYHNALNIFHIPTHSESGTVEEENKEVAAATAQAAPAPQQANGVKDSGSHGGVSTHSSTSKETAAAAAAAAAQEHATAQAAAAAAQEHAAVVAAKEAVSHELSLMRRQLVHTEAVLAERERALEEARALQFKESAKVLKLEAELAELRKKLSAMAELEAEVEKWKSHAKEAEKKSTKGVWGYISGS